jgi:hypothetical protein
VRCRRLRPGLALLLGALFLIPPAVVADGSVAVPTAPQAIAILNAQRRALGLPPVRQRADWSAACMAHVRYMIDNPVAPGADTASAHREVAGLPGYSPEGAWAGANAVLAPGGGSWDQPAADPTGPSWPTPWETAPIHLAQLLAPQLREIGVASASATDGSVFSCATTWPGYTSAHPATNSVLTYPADGSTIYTKELASETPFTPGERVGLPGGTVTGPYLYAFAWGPFTNPRTRVAAASLTGPGGAVDVRIFDVSLGDGLLPAGSALLIPVSPLRERSTYSASITFVLGRTTLVHAWSFHTGGAARRVVTGSCAYARLSPRTRATGTGGAPSRCRRTR